MSGDGSMDGARDIEGEVSGVGRMGWSYRLGSLAGIDVYIHATFLLLVGWVVLVSLRVAQSWWFVLNELVFVGLVFGTVVLHELGHALTARRYGIKTHDIILLPIGGIARLERMPEDSTQELLVAVAGPLVNMVLAASIYLFLNVAAVVDPFNPFDWMVRGELLPRLFWTNIALALFNLLPAFPMDGGRILRALLGFFIDFASATRVAAGIGQGVALLLGFTGLMVGHPFLLFIALFVWIGAGKESQDVQVREIFRGVPVGAVMVRSFKTLSSDDTLERALALTLEGFQVDFPVLDASGTIVGILTRNAMLRALSAHGESARVGDAMERSFATAHADELLGDVFLRVSEGSCRSIPVVNGNGLVGILTADNIGEFVMIESARRSL